MAVELKVPAVGESITEVEIGRWLKSEGDPVQKDEPIVEIETDKVTMELPAPAAGTISQALKSQGESAEVGEVIGYMEEGAAAEGQSGAKQQAAGQSGSTQQGAATAEKPAQAEKSDNGSGEKKQLRVMPAARRLMEQHGISEDQIEPTGPGGRILKEDVERRIGKSDQQPAASAKPEQPPQAASTDRRTQRQPAAPPDTAAGREEERVPMSPLRRRIAERLVQAQQNAAMLTTFNEVDLSAVMDLRNRHKEAFEKKYGIRLGFMSFFVKASIDALKQFPAVNAEIREKEIVYKNYYDIGIAVSSEKGLVVPVLRNTERMSFADIELAIADYGKRVRENKIELEELQGGTFTITNGGVFGSLLSTPILNPPQSGVLGMHTIQQRPVAVNGEVKIRPMMYVALTYDHRIVDGREAVTFLRRIKEAVEEPNRMLMEI